MSTAISFNNHPHFTFSDERQAAVKSISMKKVNFNVPEEVEEARRQITQMGVFDKFVDWAFRDHGKKEALAILADKVIADMRLAHAVKTGKSPAEIQSLEVARHAPHARFADMLSPQGIAAILERSNISSTEDTMQWTPIADDPDTASLLTLTLHIEDAQALFGRFNGAAEMAHFYWQRAEYDRLEGAEKADLRLVAGHLFMAAKDYKSATTAWLAAAHEFHKSGVQQMKRYVALTPIGKAEALFSARTAELQAAKACEQAAAAAANLDNKYLGNKQVERYVREAGVHQAMADDPFAQYGRLHLIRTELFENEA